MSSTSSSETYFASSAHHATRCTTSDPPSCYLPVDTNLLCVSDPCCADQGAGEVNVGENILGQTILSSPRGWNQVRGGVLGPCLTRVEVAQQGSFGPCLAVKNGLETPAQGGMPAQSLAGGAQFFHIVEELERGVTGKTLFPALECPGVDLTSKLKTSLGTVRNFWKTWSV